MSADTDDPDDAIEYFIEDMTFHGKAERTREEYRRVLRRFESFLADDGRNPSGTVLTPGDATHRDCMAWVHSLRGTVADSTVAIYAAYLHRFYAYMTQIGVYESNPMALVTEEMDERIDTDPERRDISVGEMREFVRDITHPLDRAVVVTFLKTGIRVGELCNLDLRDLSLGGDDVQEAYELGERAQLSNRGNSLYVAAEPSRGDPYNGEERSASNKRKRPTVIPVDGELARVLRRWLAIRPDVRSAADPLFVRTSEDWGGRLDPPAVRHVVETHARRVGWHRTGGGATENVTPHYFRHFFTTHLRDRTGDRGVVKYLRGDVAEDVIDTYTHNWGDRVRDLYEANVYSLLD